MLEKGSEIFDMLARALTRMLAKVRRFRIVRRTLSRQTLAYITGGIAGVILCVTLVGYYGVYQPPTLFPSRTLITIPEGTSLDESARILRTEHVIRSELSFRVLGRLLGEGGRIQAGDYYFDHPIALLEVLTRITRGEYGLEPIRITIPEGATTYQMAELFADRLMRFDPKTFLLLAREKEGYLYPDTYMFLPNATVSQVIEALESTFYERIRDLETDIAASGRPIHEIITMASLLEKEARVHEERKEIAGVLWHRIDVGMKLQVDAVFGYIKSTETFSPKFSDLEIDSPYNTYMYKGLPPGPIGNPSLSSIEAAVKPIPTDALFYLHGRDGTLHLALDYKEHLVNRRKYLD